LNPQVQRAKFISYFLTTLKIFIFTHATPPNTFSACSFERSAMLSASFVKTPPS